MSNLKTILLRYFEDRGDFDVDDLIYEYGDPRQALLHFRVFYPEFVKVAGCVVLKSILDGEGGSEKLTERLAQNPDDAQKILEGYRWVEVPYLFLKDDLNDEEDYFLAQLIAESWKGALMSQFPEQGWETKVLEPEETGSTVGVCFEEQI
jgi:hypothetical protein